MASLVICNFSSPTPNLIPKSPQRLLLNSLSLPNMKPVRFCCRKTRGLSMVTRAGPGTNTYIFAFVLPLSLLAITVFTSIRIADKLDREFLEEVFFFILYFDFFVPISYFFGFASIIVLVVIFMLLVDRNFQYFG